MLSWHSGYEPSETSASQKRAMTLPAWEQGLDGVLTLTLPTQDPPP